MLRMLILSLVRAVPPLTFADESLRCGLDEEFETDIEVFLREAPLPLELTWRPPSPGLPIVAEEDGCGVR